MSAIGKIKASRVNNQFANTFVGQKGTLFYDAGNGLLRFSDGSTPGGQPVAVALPPGTITLANLEVVDTTLTTFQPNVDLNLETNGSGNINLVGNVHIHTTSEGIAGNSVFTVSNDGFTVINVPVITVGKSGLLVNGTNNHGGIGPQVPGVTLRCVGNDGMSSIISNDSFGNVAFPSLVHRYARGTSLSPTATQTGDKFGLFVGLGYGTTNYSLSSTGLASTSIDFAATENYTDTKNGSQIEFYTAPTGSNVRTLSATMTANSTIFPGNVSIAGNLVAGNVVANTVGTLTGNVLGTVLTASQPNITTVGTLGSLSVTGNVTAANIALTGNVNSTWAVIDGITIGNNSITSSNTAVDINIGATSSTANVNINRTTVFKKEVWIQGNLHLNDTNAIGSGFNKTGGTVTANGSTGQVTSNADTLAKNAAGTFTINNNYITNDKDIVVLNIASGGTVNSYSATVTRVNAAGFCNVTVTNNGTGPLAEALTFNFAIIKVN